jgi:hypothetical protein
MTFEDFFKKKRIDLAALQQGEPALFSEFKKHYEQMGEKSFDHTKKYWFNKLRLQYQLPPEIKTEKPKIENQLAEQTVNEELNEMAAPSPKVGFTPRFKASTPPKPAEDISEEKKEEAPAATPPKVGFTPRFKAGVTKPVEVISEEKEAEEKEAEEAPVEDKPKVGFTPRFKAGLTKSADASSEEKKEEAPIEDTPKIGFTPRFKAGATKPTPPAPPEE